MSLELDIQEDKEPCPLCERPMFQPSDHHLVPKCRGGRKGDTVLICRDCHNAIHALFSNKELESTYNSVDSLLANEKFAGAVKWISKQDPGGKIKFQPSRNQRRRGRNG